MDTRYDSGCAVNLRDQVMSWIIKQEEALNRNKINAEVYLESNFQCLKYKAIVKISAER